MKSPNEVKLVSSCKVDGICSGHTHWTATVNWDALGLLLKLEYKSYIIWDDFFES